MKKLKKVSDMKPPIPRDKWPIQSLVEQMQAPGDGIFVVTSLANDEAVQQTLGQTVQAVKVSHEKFVNFMREFADPLGLEVEVKTVFLIRKKKEGQNG
jgi:hypothetical protein